MLVIAWIIAVIMIYKVSSMENETIAFDPYDILEISEVLSTAFVHSHSIPLELP